MTERGFEPEVIEIQAGDTVLWVNNRGQAVWPASDPHPTHTGYIGFDALGNLFPGDSYRFTFRRPAEVTYHDHIEAGLAGSGQPLTGKIIIRPAETAEVQPRPASPIKIEVTRPKLPLKPAPEEPVEPPRPPRTFTVLIDESGFNPQSIEVRAGDTVRWINGTRRPFWPASDPHPTHTGFPGFDALGDLLEGDQYRYTFRRPGAYPYHNHTQARADAPFDTGMVIVAPGL